MTEKSLQRQRMFYRKMRFKMENIKFKNGKLKIMHITDTHLDHDNIDMSLYLINWACKKEKPDVAVITGDNVHSIEMHRSMGYELIGTFPKAGFKHDIWLDVVWMAKVIGEKENAPLPLMPFAELDSKLVVDALAEYNENFAGL